MESYVKREYVIDINDLCDTICLQVEIDRHEVFQHLCNFHTYAMNGSYTKVNEQNLKEVLCSGWTEDDQFILEQVNPLNNYERVITVVLYLIDEMKIPEKFILLISW